MITRQMIYDSWHKYYGTRLENGEKPKKVAESMRATIESLRMRMRALGRSHDRIRLGYVKSDLTQALGMSLGVHQQLLAGLTSSSRGDTLKGGGRVRKQISEASKTQPSEEDTDGKDSSEKQD